jgi:isopentenyldiphosphate isomerase
MKDLLFNDIKKSKLVVIIGVAILGDSKLKNKMKECFYDEVANGNKKAIVLMESDNQLFQMSLLTDIAQYSRISFEEFKIRRDYLYKELTKLKITKSLLMSLFTPSFMIKTDDNIWHMPVTSFDADNYEKIRKNSNEYNIINSFINFLTTEQQGLKYSCKPDEEMLELFDQNKVPRGIFPRNSFYNTDHYQYVIWGLIFNREGKLLIHKRSANAKDNQDMWDKSIGGHIDFKKERSSSDAAVRELIEELYTVEKDEQTGHAFSMLSEDAEKVYYLGDWRIEDFGSEYLEHIKLLEEPKEKGEEPWVFYKLPEAITHNTPRLLPNNKGEKWLRVIVDSYVFISNTSGVTEHSIKKMKNSEYLLVEPNELKSWMDTGKGKDGKAFAVTPDLKFIMTGKMRDIIEKVSLAIKYSDIRESL